MAESGEDFYMTEGMQVRDFTPVEQIAEDIVDYSIRQDLTPGVPSIKNLGTGKPMQLLEFAQKKWKELGATGSLRPGRVPYREHEIMRYVPEI